MMDMLKAFSRARRIFANPTKGIEYNQLMPNRKVSRGIYRVDIARNPQIIKDTFERVDVQSEARFANSERDLVDNEARRVTGRST